MLHHWVTIFKWTFKNFALRGFLPAALPWNPDWWRPTVLGCPGTYNNPSRQGSLKFSQSYNGVLDSPHSPRSSMLDCPVWHGDQLLEESRLFQTSSTRELWSSLNFKWFCSFPQMCFFNIPVCELHRQLKFSFYTVNMGFWLWITEEKSNLNNFASDNWLQHLIVKKWSESEYFLKPLTISTTTAICNNFYVPFNSFSFRPRKVIKNIFLPRYTSKPLYLYAALCSPSSWVGFMIHWRFGWHWLGVKNK